MLTIGSTQPRGHNPEFKWQERMFSMGDDGLRWQDRNIWHDYEYDQYVFASAGGSTYGLPIQSCWRRHKDQETYHTTHEIQFSLCSANLLPSYWGLWRAGSQSRRVAGRLRTKLCTKFAEKIKLHANALYSWVAYASLLLLIADKPNYQPSSAKDGKQVHPSRQMIRNLS